MPVCWGHTSTAGIQLAGIDLQSLFTDVHGKVNEVRSGPQGRHQTPGDGVEKKGNLNGKYVCGGREWE